MKIKVGDHIGTRQDVIEDGSLYTWPVPDTKYILFFYPKDNTPGCTAEACSIRDSYRELKDLGFELLGVSVDKIQSHQKFLPVFCPYLRSNEKAIGNWR